MIHVARVVGDLIKNVSAEASLFWVALLWQGAPHLGWAGVEAGQWGGGWAVGWREGVNFPGRSGKFSSFKGQVFLNPREATQIF